MGSDVSDTMEWMEGWMEGGRGCEHGCWRERQRMGTKHVRKRQRQNEG